MATPSPALPDQPPSSVVLESKQLLADAERLLIDNRLQESETAFMKVVSLAVDASRGFYGLGVIQFRRGRFADAAALFQSCLRSDPMNANVYYYLGESWERLNLPAAAAAFFEKALAINPNHRAALQKLSSSRSAVSPQMPVRPAFIAPSPQAVAATPAVPANVGINEYIRSDPSLLARQTIQLIDSIKFVSVSPRLSAFVGKVFLGPALCFIALIAFAVIVGNNVRRADQLVGILMASAFILPFAMFLYGVLSVKTTKYTLENGRLVIASGIFNKKFPNHELYKVEDIELHQTFLNRLTGDGELILHVASGNSRHRLISLRGFAKISELQVLFDQLRNLIVLLRTGQWGKGIIR